MMPNRGSGFLFVILLAAGCSPSTGASLEPDYCVPDDGSAGFIGAPEGPAAFVDPFIGTDGLGNVVPGALVPHGMVKLGPDTDIRSGAIEGYEYSDTKLQGFSHTHLEGPGGVEYGYSEILLLPQTGALSIDPSKNPASFSHATEINTPGFYAVTLDDSGIRVELTATAHAGLQRYTFPACGDARVLLDVGHTRGMSKDGQVKIVGDDTVEGYGLYQTYPLLATVLLGTAPTTGLSKVYFSARFNRRFANFGTWSDLSPTPGERAAEGPYAGAWVEFGERAGRVIEARVGISFVSVEQARANREGELEGKSFEAVRDAAIEAWNQHIGRVEVEGGTNDQRKMLFTALYHALMQPADYTEGDRFFVGADGHGAVLDAGKHHFYADDWCAWDTARTTHPLVTILDPEAAGDMMQSYVTWFEQAGWASKCSWHALGDSRVMTGNFHFCAMADAWTKGLRDFDGEGAYAAMHKGSMEGEGPFTINRCGSMSLGTPHDYIELGYVPAECDTSQSASMTLEHAYNDWCVARMADALGKVDDAAYFEARSQSWKNLWNPAHGFFQSRKHDGTFVEPFDPIASDAGFTEANAWKYLWTVPHDVCGLVKTLGGAAAFEAKLDAFFDGGHFDPTNEPDFHAPYLYGAVGAPAKAAERLRAIVASAYAPTPSGLPGNDDAGATSAWLAFALLGFYPVTPGDGTYWLGSPHFDRAVIHVDPAKGIDFIIEVEGAGSGAMYVQSVTLNGEPLDVPRLSHADIVKGGKLALVMGDAPSAWATTPVCP